VEYNNFNIFSFYLPGVQELTMQTSKKKSSPRNSPRNPASPRTPGSPRGGASPRSMESAPSPHQPWGFLAGQDLVGVPAHLCAIRESQSKSPIRDGGRSPLTEQRKSPYNMLAAAGLVMSAPRVGGHVNSDTVQPVGDVFEPLGLRQQCNMDNIALIKEAFAQPHLSQLNMLAASKDPSFLQKLEKLKPIFMLQKQMSAVNGLENLNHIQRPVPGPSLKPNHSGLEVGSSSSPQVSCTASIGSNLHTATVTSAVNAANMAKSVKVNSDDQKAPSSSVHKRSTSSTESNSSNATHSLPAPSRLTASVQKLLNFPLIDHPNTSLPPSIRRSPSSSGNVARPSPNSASNATNSQCNVSVRGQTPPGLNSMLTTSKHQLDNTHIDLDSITPSISGFGLGPLNLHLDNSHGPIDFSNHSESSSMPSLTIMDTVITGSVLPHNVSGSTTKLVPAVTGSISSHKSDDTTVKAFSLPSSVTNADSVVSSAPVVNSSIDNLLCNSDSQMAVKSVLREVSLPKHNHASSVRGPPVLQPQTSFTQSNSVSQDTKPKSPYPQMGLTEMLQETANIKMTNERQSGPAYDGNVFQNVSQSIKSTSENTNSVQDLTVDKVNHSDLHEAKTEVNKKSNSEVHQTNDHQTNNALSNSSHPYHQSVNNGDNSEIPKLKRQTNLNVQLPTNCKSSPLNTPTIGSDSCDSDLGKSLDSCSSASSTPPVLTAVSDFEQVKRQTTSSSNDSSVLELSQPDLDSRFSQLDEPVPDLEELTLSLMSKSKDKHPHSSRESKPSPVTVEKQASEDSENSQTVFGAKVVKSSRKRRASSESVEDKLDDHDLAPRQLRSRKRPNNSDTDSSQPDDGTKKIKLETGADTCPKSEQLKETVRISNAKSGLPHVNDHGRVPEDLNPNAHQENIKAGLRTRTVSKSSQPVESQEKPKTGSSRDSKEVKKDSRGTPSKTAPEKKAEPVKVDEGKRLSQSRRSKQSPSLEKPPAPPAAGKAFEDMFYFRVFSPTMILRGHKFGIMLSIIVY